MRRWACAFLIVISTPLFAGSVIVARHAAITTASSYATQAGLEVLKRGGNAIDAAVAAAFVLAVAHPQAGNLGGGGFLLYYDARTNAVWSLDFLETAPGGATAEMFAGKSPRSGAIAAGAPGTVAGLHAAHQRFGRQRWSDLLAPAIGLASDGVRVSGDLSTDFVSANTERTIDPLAPTLGTGSLLVQKELAHTLERIAAKGAADFYHGETAGRLVDSVRAAGGVLSLRDLREYKPIWRAPVRIAFRHCEIYTAAPPSAAGLMIAEELNILGAYDLGASGYQTPKTIHLLAEVARRAAIDRDRYLADPATARVPYRELLSAERAAQWRASIDPLRATPTISLTEPPTSIAESAHTTHLTAIDSLGNVAALTTTLSDDFGSGFLVPRCGFYLNDAMRNFGRGASNGIQPGKRVITALAPTIILRGKQPYLALGAAGGSAIPNLVLQVFLSVAVHGKSLFEAIDAPRYDQQAVPDDIVYETGRASNAVLTQLTAMGHGVLARGVLGDVNALLMDATGITAVADPRHGGSAGGY
jgi:gamma-glutamyltranspeptidase/glutathione hydrolase